MGFVVFVISFVLIVGCGWVGAQHYLSQPQALQTAFAPAATVERQTAYLTPQQKKQIETLSGADVESRIVTYYVARSSSGVQGIAFFDRRLVRTLPVTFMTVVNPAGTVARVDVLAFDEPNDYLPPKRWLDLYRSRVLNRDMAIGRGIPHITGASLTSQTMNDGIRLALATYQVAVQPTLQ